MQTHRVLEKPLLTEKSTQMQAEGNWVSFRVNPNANKIEIKQAVESIFDVHVLRVNTSVVRGQWKRFGRTLGQSASWKKAMVQLKEGDKIELFEGA
jgi:large subunit ribosomal protein L23